MKKTESQLKILKIFEENPKSTQRQVASKLDLSLGKTNYLIRSLLDKGYVKLSNFKRSDNKIGYLYILTPKGVFNKSKLTNSFIEHKSKEYNRLKEEIESLRNDL